VIVSQTELRKTAPTATETGFGLRWHADTGHQVTRLQVTNLLTHLHDAANAFVAQDNGISHAKRELAGDKTLIGSGTGGAIKHLAESTIRGDWGRGNFANGQDIGLFDDGCFHAVPRM